MEHHALVDTGSVSDSVHIDIGQAWITRFYLKRTRNTKEKGPAMRVCNVGKHYWRAMSDEVAAALGGGSARHAIPSRLPRAWSYVRTKLSTDFCASGGIMLREVSNGTALRHALLGGFCTLALAACGTASAGNAVEHQFDGTYRGNSSLVRGWGYACGTIELPLTLAIVNSRLDYPFQAEPLEIQQVPVNISVDGSFTTYLQYAIGTGEASEYIPDHLTITGRIVGNTLRATANDLFCSHNIVLRRNR